MPRPASGDRITIAKLTGIAGRHASQGTPESEAVAELQATARGRADLLAHVAGASLAAAEQSAHPTWDQRAAELCIAAGADETLIPGMVAEVRTRLHRPLPGSPE